MSDALADIYDDLPDGPQQAQRRHNQERLAELEASTQERRARMAQVLACVGGEVE